MAIIVSKNGKNAQILDKSVIEKEAYLQKYIQNNPESIPIYEIDEDKKLFVAKREFPTNAGPIDVLAFDESGEIYVVETKLYKNPDKRLVIAQVLDYGAALWKHYNDFNEFIEILNQETRKIFSLNFQDKLKEFFDLDDEQIELALDMFQQNLNEGNIKFVILMDKIGDRLKDLILYVNQNSQFDIYAVQIEYYKYEEYEIMIPKVFGAEVKKSIKKSSTSTRIYWNAEGFQNELQKLNSNIRFKIMELLDFAKKENCLEGWGTGKIPAFNFKIDNPVRIGKKLTVFTIWSDGNINIGHWLGSVRKKVPEAVDEFFKKVNKIEGISISQKQVRTSTFPIDNVDPNDFDKLKGCIAQLKSKIDKVI